MMKDKPIIDGGQEPREGPQCRRCGCRHLPVQHTARRQRVIVRYRQCRACGANHMTTERLTGQ